MKTNKIKSLGTLITKQNTVAKISQKETRFFKSVFHKRSAVPEHLSLSFIAATVWISM